MLVGWVGLYFLEKPVELNFWVLAPTTIYATVVTVETVVKVVTVVTVVTVVAVVAVVIVMTEVK